MASKQHVHTLMTEIGPLLELLEVTEFDDENVWTLVVDEDDVLFVDYEPETDRLVLSAEVAHPPGDTDLKGLYATLLTYNNQWQETGGTRMALDATDGNVVQIFELPAAGLDLHDLQIVVTNFVDLLKTWRGIVDPPRVSWRRYAFASS